MIWLRRLNSAAGAGAGSERCEATRLPSGS